MRLTTLKEEVGLKDLKKEVQALTAALKLTDFQGAKPKKANVSQNKQAQKSKTLDKTKSKGPQPSAAGPFSPTDKPMQCFKCGGWGHGWRNCPSQGNINWRELYRASLSPAVEGLQEFEKFQNPDPLYRLIGEANESHVIVEGVNFKALIDSWAQVSSISEPMAKLLGLEIQNLQTLIGLEGAHGGEVPYLGYTGSTLGNSRSFKLQIRCSHVGGA